MGTLSVCVIVKNEAANIADAIRNAWQFADEIVVVDTGSFDHTRSIAERLGARVFYKKWNNDFSAARNESIARASGDWFVWMDADDRVPLESADKIIELKNNSPTAFYSFTLRNVDPFDVNVVGGLEVPQSRMFPHAYGIYFKNRIHEQATKSAYDAGLTMESRPDIVIEHHGYKDKGVLLEKLKRNHVLQMMDLGFPENSEFDIEEKDGFICIRSCGMLIIWYYRKFVGVSDSEDSAAAAKSIIEKYKGNVKTYAMSSGTGDELAFLHEEINRISNARLCFERG